MKSKHLTLLLTALFLIIGIYSCSKDTTTPTTPTNPTTPACKDGDICFTLNSTAISKAAGGYAFADTFLFVKYEEGSKQLSIDIFGNTPGNYTISDVRKKGNGRIYYFPDNTNTQYMASKGSLNISAYDATTRVLTGTFSGTLYKYDNNSSTFNYSDSVVITNGTFTKVTLTP
jgi:hypothetical protein